MNSIVILGFVKKDCAYFRYASLVYFAFSELLVPWVSNTVNLYLMKLRFLPKYLWEH